MRFTYSCTAAVLIVVSVAIASDKPLADQVDLRWHAVTAVSREVIETGERTRRIEVDGSIRLADEHDLVALSNRVHLRRVITDKGEALEQAGARAVGMPATGGLLDFRFLSSVRDGLDLIHREIPVNWAVQVASEAPKKLAIVGGYVEVIRARNIHVVEIAVDDQQWHEIPGVIRLRLAGLVPFPDSSLMTFEYSAAKNADALAPLSLDEQKPLPAVTLRRVMQVHADGTVRPIHAGWSMRRQIAAALAPEDPQLRHGEVSTHGLGGDAVTLRFEFAEAPRVERAHFSIHQLDVPRFDDQ